MGQDYDGSRGDKVRRNHHDLDAAVEAVIQPAPATPSLVAAEVVPAAVQTAPGDIKDIIEEERAKERQTPRQKQDAKLLSFCNLVSSAELLAMDLRPRVPGQGRAG